MFIISGDTKFAMYVGYVQILKLCKTYCLYVGIYQIFRRGEDLRLCMAGELNKGKINMSLCIIISTSKYNDSRCSQ